MTAQPVSLEQMIAWVQTKSNAEVGSPMRDAILLALRASEPVHSSHKLDAHCIACGLSTEDERIKQGCEP
jgi:hypothetical protein